MPLQHLGHQARVWAVVAALAALLGCDQQRIDKLEEGVSTEADVAAAFGKPDTRWDTPDGSHVLAFSRQPEGDANYQITIGPDGKMSALRQVLTPRNFAQITPGMTADEVLQRLGKPMKITPYELKQQIHYDWRFRDGPNPTDRQIFTAVFSPDLRLLATQTVPDSGSEQRGR